MKEPKIQLIDNFIFDSDNLLETVKTNAIWDTRLKKRKTASYGVSYNYSGMVYPHTKMLEELVTVCKKIEVKIGFLPNNCLLNYYLDGNSTMGYHSDTSEELKEGTGVAIISLGAERYISYRSKSDPEIKYQYLLKPSCLLYMDNDVQQHWMHAIPKQKDAGERISLTFRHIIK